MTEKEMTSWALDRAIWHFLGAPDGVTDVETGKILERLKEKIKKVELTVEAVKRAAGKCGTAKEVLKELFPGVFGESEWVDVTKEVIIYSWQGGVGVWHGNYCPFIVTVNEHSEVFGTYKIEKEKLWRKK